MSPARRWLATVALMAATILTVLDQTIANVILPQMQAALGATPDTISWVLTSYVLAAAIATPMTGWLTGRFGRSRFFILLIIGFTISSGLCGMAASLPMMVAARVAQGFFGAFIVPMTQSFLYDMNPPEDRIRALTIWGAGSTAAPILGPVLGGYLTEALNWRWVFLINLPIGVLTLIGLLATLPKFPSMRRSFDYSGFILVSLALCGLQLALDRGTHKGWLESTEILIELGLSAAAFWMLFFYLRTARQPIIPIRLFRYANFNAGMVIGVVIMPVVTAGLALLPPLLQVLLGYPVELAGLVMIPRAITMMAGILIAGRLMKLVDGRILVFVGMLLVVASLQLQTRFTLVMDSELIIWSGLLQGLGTGLVMTPINIMIVSCLPDDLRTEGAALYMLARNIGTSIMIAITTAILAHNIQLNHAEVGESLQSGSLPFHMSQMLGGAYLSERIAAMANAEITRQAMMIAYLDDFWLMMWGTILAIPVLLFLRPMHMKKDDVAIVVE